MIRGSDASFLYAKIFRRKNNGKAEEKRKTEEACGRY
jgi:hypothetical protein